jgi:hypothetical protein
MPALSNHRHELFAQAVAKGKSQREAYIDAGYSVRPEIADVNASRLLSGAKVADRVGELQERAAIKVELTLLDIVQMLTEDRELARTCEQSGSAVSASMGIAKLLGHLKDKVELTGKDGGPLQYQETAKADIADIFGPTPHEITIRG